MLTIAFVLIIASTAMAYHGPTVQLRNAAIPGTLMPIVGIGTGGYTRTYEPGNIPEFWNDSLAETAIYQWLNDANGERIDTSQTYGDEVGIGAALKKTSKKRDEYFITSKTGPGNPLGYNDTLAQFTQIVQELGTAPDLLLIHWPSFGDSESNGFHSSTDPACDSSSSTRNASLCRQHTWLAMEHLFKTGQVKAIGVSNFEENHLRDIFALNSLKPAVNQVEMHPFFHEPTLIKFCQDNDILFNGYAPFGAPDFAPKSQGWPYSVLDHPTIVKIAKAHNTSPAQATLAWMRSFGIVVNPRTANLDHMKQNLDFFDIKLTTDEISEISALNSPSRKVCPNPQNMI